MKYMDACLMIIALALMFVMLDLYCVINVPMSIRFLTMYIVAVLSID